MKLRVINTTSKSKPGYDAVIESQSPFEDGSYQKVIGKGYKEVADAQSAVRMWLYNQRQD